jgi:hypothetical protein
MHITLASQATGWQPLQPPPITAPISIPPGPPGLRPPHFAGASSPGSAVAKAHYTKARRAKRILVKPYTWTTKKLIEKEC